MTMPICLWSGPRNVSTALMYSFAQRDDIRVVDEPLYGHYLRVTGARHPASFEVMAAMNCDGDQVMRTLIAEQDQHPAPRLFLKHMAHHLVDLDLAFLSHTSNLFLIRDPQEMLPSLTVQVPHAALEDTGLKRQWQLFEELCDAGQRPAIVDSRLLLQDPEEILQQLCGHLGLQFDRCMLSWRAGPRPEGGEGRSRQCLRVPPREAERLPDHLGVDSVGEGRVDEHPSDTRAAVLVDRGLSDQGS